MTKAANNLSFLLFLDARRPDKTRGVFKQKGVVYYRSPPNKRGVKFSVLFILYKLLLHIFNFSFII